ncbi:MAG TPA: hypothetical protein VF771_16675 [Longimicrobiaceae bacterium]
MPRSSSPATVVVHAFLIALGVVTAVAGVLGALSFREMWWAFAAMAVGGAVLAYGAARGIAGWAKAVEVEETTTREMVATAQARATGAAVDTGPVLAHWTYPPEEWRAYVAAEVRFRVRQALLLGAGAVAVMAVFLALFREPWSVKLPIALGLGVFVAIWRLVMAMSAHHRNIAVARGEVIVGPTAMLVNGRHETIEDGQIRFAGARVLQRARPAVLEIAIRVPGKYRSTDEEYRIPIPAGKEDEARAVAEALERAHRPAVDGGTARAALPRR